MEEDSDSEEGEEEALGVAEEAPRDEDNATLIEMLKTYGESTKNKNHVKTIKTHGESIQEFFGPLTRKKHGESYEKSFNLLKEKRIPELNNLRCSLASRNS